MASIREARSVDSALAAVARELSLRLACGDNLAALGIEVHVVLLSGRDGGVYDRWDRKAILVDERQPPSEQTRIAIHELGHLLLGYVNRAEIVRLSREAQERACEQFAQRVTATDARAERRGSAPFTGALRSADHRVP